MCSSKGGGTVVYSTTTANMDQIRQSGAAVAKINGRPVLQPTCNRVPSSLDRRNSLKKPTQKPPLSLPLPSPTHSPRKVAKTVSRTLPSPPISPKNKSPRAHQPITVDDVDTSTTPALRSPATTPPVKKPTKKVASPHPPNHPSSLSLTAAMTGAPPGSIAAARREEVANLQVLRKMKIAHYGRKKKAGCSPNKINLNDMVDSGNNATSGREDKKCFFITSNSDPIYVAYHDEEWGVPVQDDKILFELLVLSAAQVGSDWTTILKKRQLMRDAFAGFDAEIVADFGEKKIASISAECGLEVSQVRGAVDNANKILKIKEDFGSFSNYLWRFVNYKPIATSYKSCQRIPVKTSKSEAISKDMVKRGLRYVGAAAVHSLMQAAGLTNDHLHSCPRHSQLQLQPNIIPGC